MYGLIRAFLSRNKGMLVVLASALLMGLVIGCCSFSKVGDEEELREFLSYFFTNLSQIEKPELAELFRQSLLRTVLLSGLLFLSGFSLFGIGIIPFLVWYKGFLSGFTVMVFCRLYGVKGISFLFFGIAPSAIIWIPFLLFGALACSKTSVSLLECCCRGRVKKRFRLLVFELCSSMLLCLSGLLCAGIIEVYLVPKLLGLIGNLYL